jgi:hypothetical protein
LFYFHTKNQFQPTFLIFDKDQLPMT